MRAHHLLPMRLTAAAVAAVTLAACSIPLNDDSSTAADAAAPAPAEADAEDASSELASDEVQLPGDVPSASPNIPSVLDDDDGFVYVARFTSGVYGHLWCELEVRQDGQRIWRESRTNPATCTGEWTRDVFAAVHLNQFGTLPGESAAR